MILMVFHSLRPNISGSYQARINEALPSGAIRLSLESDQKKTVSKRTISKRKVRSIRLGTLEMEVEKGYDGAGKSLINPEVRELVADGMNFAYDTIWEVTRLRYLENMQREQIRQRMPFPISSGAVSNLYTEGIAYISLLIESRESELKSYYLKDDRPFVLQIDGTNEGGKSTVYTVRDAFTGNVLHACKIRSENQPDLEEILRLIEQRFRKPDAVVSDMSAPTLAAVRDLWNETVPSHICQFHFLRDLGNDLLKVHHEKMRSEIKKSLVSGELNQIRARMEKHVREGETEIHKNVYSEAINMVDWIKDYKTELTGQGTPFDLALKNYYERCVTMKKQVDKILKKKKRKVVKSALELIQRRLKRIERQPLSRAYRALKKDALLFERIRAIFVLPEDSRYAPLSNNQTSDAPSKIQQVKIDEILVELKTLDAKEKSFAKSMDRKRYEKVITQLEKYRNKLDNTIEFNGKPFYLPRTNNLCETGFRAFKRDLRQMSGKKNLRQILDSIPAEVLYLQNLKDPNFHQILFGDLPEYLAFTSIDRKQVREKLKAIRALPTKKVELTRIRKKDFLESSLIYMKKPA